MSSLLERKKEIANLCVELIDVYIQNDGRPFDRAAPVELITRRAELLNVIKSKTDKYVDDGGIVLGYSFDLPNDEQVTSGRWKSLIAEIVNLFDDNGLVGNYTEFTFNDQQGLRSVFFDQKCLDTLKSKMQGRTDFGSIRLIALNNEAPVFKEFGLPYLGYMNTYGLMALRLKAQLFSEK